LTLAGTAQQSLQSSPWRQSPPAGLTVKKSVIELEHFLPYRLSVLANLISNTIASTYQSRFGLTIPEWRVLAVLTRHPGLAATDVALKTRMDAVAVSRAVNRLLRNGRVLRTVSRADRRRSVLHVSASGAAVYRVVAPEGLELERQLLAALDAPTRKVLDDALNVLTQRAEAIASSADQSTNQMSGRPAARNADAQVRRTAKPTPPTLLDEVPDVAHAEQRWTRLPKERTSIVASDSVRRRRRTSRK
jgi:DNA-binding MarR family transcriptional regulator